MPTVYRTPLVVPNGCGASPVVDNCRYETVRWYQRRTQALFRSTSRFAELMTQVTPAVTHLKLTVGRRSWGNEYVPSSALYTCGFEIPASKVRTSLSAGRLKYRARASQITVLVDE